jgi:hypothetical protein
MGKQIAIGPDTYEVETEIVDAAAARTKGDVVRIGSSATGIVDVSLADDTNVYRVGVVLHDAASGDKYLCATKGPVSATVPSATYTAANGLDILDGAVRDSTAAAEKPNGLSANNDFGVIMTGGTTVTSVTVYLYGDAVTAQT